MQKVILGQNMEIFNGKLWDISKVIKVAEYKCLAQQYVFIKIFCDLQLAINRLKVIDNKAG